VKFAKKVLVNDDAAISVTSDNVAMNGGIVSSGTVTLTEETSGNGVKLYLGGDVDADLTVKNVEVNADITVDGSLNASGVVNVYKNNVLTIGANGTLTVADYGVGTGIQSLKITKEGATNSATFDASKEEPGIVKNNGTVDSTTAGSYDGTKSGMSWYQGAVSE